jgi:hypothetical protein
MFQSLDRLRWVMKHTFYPVSRKTLECTSRTLFNCHFTKLINIDGINLKSNLNYDDFIILCD